MKIIRNIEVPTGNILIVNGERGNLECLSLGDYGKQVNIKCDSMGLSRVPNAVRHTRLLPLTEKWVITVSTQYGCSSDCIFCDVPKVGRGINATSLDIMNQVYSAMSLHPEIGYSDRLNVHYARMGEPTWNPNVIDSAKMLKIALKDFLVHPVVSTMCPKKNDNLYKFLKDWMGVKNDTFNGEAGLQLSINSTSSKEREHMFSGNALDLKRISDMINLILYWGVKGRKITLNFAVAGYEINAPYLAKLFPPQYFICKLTPMHKTNAALGAGIKTDGDYTEYHPYEKYEKELKEAGFDVLVFIASKEEDESRITCGNAILSDFAT